MHRFSLGRKVGTGFLLAIVGLYVSFGSSRSFLWFPGFVGRETVSAATFQMQVGYYNGNGTDNRQITGLGFQPDLVIIKADAPFLGNDAMLWKSSVMTGETNAKIGEAEADVTTDNIQSLDADGFTIGADADVNTAGAVFYYMAFGGSDCTASGTFCVGSYSGNGTSQSVSTGFQPDLVTVKRSGASLAVWASSVMTPGNTNYFAGSNEDTSGAMITALSSSGFSVGSNATVNTSSNTYWFFAFKQVSGVMDVGTYTGSGVDSRTVTTTEDAGLTFEPNFVFTKATSGGALAAFNITENYGDHSFVSTNNAPGADMIQNLLPTGGFEVGTSARTNGSSVTYYYAAFGGAETHVGTGTYTMATGSYSGNGASQSITGAGFAPNLVIIKGDTAQYAVFATSLSTSTYYLANAASAFAGGISSLDADGFSLGSSATVNSSGVTYYWTAFGNAWNPDTHSGSADFAIGQYLGTGQDDSSVKRLPFQPDLVGLKVNSAASGVWRTSSTVGDYSLAFNGSELGANYIQALNSDGFQRGTAAGVNGSVNADGFRYNYFAFKAGTTMKVGSYTGNGTSLSITAPGIQPLLVWIKRTDSLGAILTNASVPAGQSQQFMNSANNTTDITSLDAAGFSVGSGTRANNSGSTYHYAVWNLVGAPGDTTDPTPGNSGTITVGTETAATIPLTWSKATDETSAQSALTYEVYYAASGTDISTPTLAALNGTKFGSTLTDASSVTITGLSNSTTYEVNIIVADEAGNKAAYTQTQGTTTDGTAPTPGSSGTITVGTETSTTIPLSWSKATDNVSAQSALTYEVYYAASGTDISTPTLAALNGTKFGSTLTDASLVTITGLSNSTTYEVNIIVSDEVGNQAAYTQTQGTTDVSADAIAPTPGSSGTITVGTETSTTIPLSWSKATDNVSAQSALTYTIYYAASGTDLSSVVNAEGNGTQFGAVLTDASSVTITGLSDSTTYEVNIVVADETGNKAVYTQTQGTTTDGTPPTAGGSGVLTISLTTANSFVVNWTKATDDISAQSAITYKVYRAASGSDLADISATEANGTQIGSTLLNASSLAMTGLTPGTRYEINVIALDEAGNKVAYTQKSAFTNATSVDLETDTDLAVLDDITCSNTREITLLLSGKHISQALVSTDPAFLQDTWIPFVADETYDNFRTGYETMPVAFTLPADAGTYTIYTMFRDTRGNNATPRAVTITWISFGCNGERGLELPGTVNGDQVSEVPFTVNLLVRGKSFSTVYVIDGLPDGTLVRRPFPNEQIYFTYYADFSGIETISDERLAELPVDLPMLPKHDAVLVKIRSNPRVYTVEGNGILHWIPGEERAREMFGEDWASYVIDIDESLLPKFTIGNPVSVFDAVKNTLRKRSDLHLI